MYLDWDPSSYPLLQKIQQSVDKYTRLWHTALDFHERYERWYYGPLKVFQYFYYINNGSQKILAIPPFLIIIL